MDDDTYFSDFNMRKDIGDDLPLYANLGIAQVEQLILEKRSDKINELIKRLQADGLISRRLPVESVRQAGKLSSLASLCQLMST